MTANDRNETFEGDQLLNKFGSCLVKVIAILVFAIIVLFTPIWSVPFAQLWYQSGFEDAVAKALAEIPDSENACIYDETVHRFVTSINQLDVERMIKRAVHDKGSMMRLDRPQRDPHF